MKYISTFICVTLLCLFSCAPASDSQYEDGYTYFVTRLGSDTLAVERFKKTGDKLIAHVILRSPRTRLSGYELTLTNQGGIANMLRYNLVDATFERLGTEASQMVEPLGDSLINQVRANDGTLRRFAMPNEAGALPFIDMVHWPFELAFNNAADSPTDSVHQKLLTGRRLSDFIIHKMGTDSLTLRHPSRGVMGVTVNASGELLKLDAALTTRKLIVTRAHALDFEAIANDFLERDRNGSPFGSLSGAINRDFSFNGADFNVQHGSPSKRGRTIFGGIVPWGQRWRTGANRATHFSTSKDLTIGTLSIPAGKYTLFTIPEPDGGTLIINKQTGQNGRSYDESHDLGRVPLTMGAQNEVTEVFTILVQETNSGGVLKLVWDQAVLSVDFTID